MINVIIKKDTKRNIRTVHVTGHAKYGPYGYDIVCAAVSVLTAALKVHLDHIGVVEDYRDTKDGGITIVFREGYRSKEALLSFVFGIGLLLCDYGDFIQMTQE